MILLSAAIAAMMTCAGQIGRYRPKGVIQVRDLACHLGAVQLGCRARLKVVTDALS